MANSPRGKYANTVFNPPIFSTPFKMEFLKEFWLFVRTRRNYWLIPLVSLLLLLGALTLLTGGSALAPFIYSLF